MTKKQSEDIIFGRVRPEIPTEGRYAQAEREESHRLRLEIAQLRDELSESQKELKGAVGALKLVADVANNVRRDNEDLKENLRSRIHKVHELADKLRFAESHIVAKERQISDLQRYNDNQRAMIEKQWADIGDLRKKFEIVSR